MRQFLFGLIVAALAWWGYDKWGNEAHASPVPSGPGGDAQLDTLLNQMQPVETDGPALHSSASNGGAAGGEILERLEVAVDGLLERVARGDAAAVSEAWAAVATGRLGADHARVIAALQPKADDFAGHLAMLGRNNAFLHSREGRAAADAALQRAMAMPDPEELTAGSQLIYLMTCGRIERADAVVRQAVDKAYGEHRIRVDRWLCSPANVAGARSYVVASGDSLARIAGKFRKDGAIVEAGTLAVLNNIHNPNALQVGQQLKVPVAPITALVEKRSFAMMLFVGEQLLRLYWVGHGQNDHTPVTEFTVLEKQPRPQWTAPDGNVYPYGHPQNILGEYFIKFGHAQYTGFGAHGTPMPETICTMSSAGCIRMLAPDIEELFRILPRGAKVVVRCSESLR